MIYLGNSPVGLALKVDLGGLTKYKQMKVTPTNVGWIEIQHSMGIVPKFIVISCAETAEPYTTEGFFRYAVASDVSCGTIGWNRANHGVAAGGLALVQASILTNGQYLLTDSVARFAQQSNNVQWSTNTEYTIDIYA